jgi:hypothetical protein
MILDGFIFVAPIFLLLKMGDNQAAEKEPEAA